MYVITLCAWCSYLLWLKMLSPVVLTSAMARSPGMVLSNKLAALFCYGTLS